MTCEKPVKIKILLVDNHHMFTQSLRQMLERESDIEVVDEADNGADAVRLTRELKPDLIVMEARLPGLSSVDVIKRLKNYEKPQSVLILTTPGDDDHSLELLLTGANGFIFKTAYYSDLVQAIRVITAGLFICSPTLERKLLKCINRADSAALGAVEQLTNREAEVLKLAAQGLNNQDIAHHLVLTIGTVKGYFVHIFSKMNVKSRTEAVVEGLKLGWISLDNE